MFFFLLFFFSWVCWVLCEYRKNPLHIHDNNSKWTMNIQTINTIFFLFIYIFFVWEWNFWINFLWFCIIIKPYQKHWESSIHWMGIVCTTRFVRMQKRLAHQMCFFISLSIREFPFIRSKNDSQSALKWCNSFLFVCYFFFLSFFVGVICDLIKQYHEFLVDIWIA